MLTAESNAHTGRELARRVFVCVAIVSVLIVWLLIFPCTGDGDSAIHYLNARDASQRAAVLMTAWSRVGFKLLLVFPAQFGIVPARATMALLTGVLAWQTMRLADDLRLPNAILAAPLLVCQPFVFALAADTMTEMPMALGIVLAIRLRWAGRPAASGLVVSLLPTIRPEGFFLICMWGAMILFAPGGGSSRRRAAALPLLAVGTAAWALAAWISSGDPAFIFHHWSWPRDMIAGHGPLWHYAVRWPVYCGPVLFPLWVIGIAPSARRRMALPWAAWGLVFAVHSVLFWRGAFGSYGLLRILACVSPVTAVVCLYGWNAVAERLRHAGILRPAGVLRRIRDTQVLGRIATVSLVALAAQWACVWYVENPQNHRCFIQRDAAEYVRSHGLLAGDPPFFAGDPVAVALVELPPLPTEVVPQTFNKADEFRLLAELPLGTIGIWDNQHSVDWFTVTIDDLPALGYTTLFESHRRLRLPFRRLVGLPVDVDEIAVVVRKDRKGRVPAGIAARRRTG